MGWGSQYGVDYKINGVKERGDSGYKVFNLTCTVCAKIVREQRLAAGLTHIVHCQVLPDGQATGYRDIERENPHLHALNHADLVYLGTSVRPPSHATPESVVRAFIDSVGDTPVPQAITRYLYYKLQGVHQMIEAFNSKPQEVEEDEDEDEEEEEED